MELFFKRYFWLVNSAVVLLVSYQASTVLSAYLKYRLLVVPRVEEPIDFSDKEEESILHTLARRSRVPTERRREIMVEVAPPAIANEEERDAQASTSQNREEKVETEKKESNIQIELIATVVTPDFEKGLALVKVDGNEAKWVSINTELKPGFRVVRITDYYIEVSDGTTDLLWKKKEKKPLALAQAGHQRRPSRHPGRVRERTKKRKKARKTKAEFSKGIKQVGPYEYRIDRAMLNEQLQDLSQLSRQARVIPNYDREAGTFRGFKLIGVRPNSVYRAIGIRSGDVILQINGEELNTPAKALELFNRLQNSSEITLDILRRGKKLSLVYKIE